MTAFSSALDVETTSISGWSSRSRRSDSSLTARASPLPRCSATVPVSSVKPSVEPRETRNSVNAPISPSSRNATVSRISRSRRASDSSDARTFSAVQVGKSMPSGAGASSIAARARA